MQEGSHRKSSAATVAHESLLIATRSYIKIVVSVCMQVQCSLKQMLEEGYYHKSSAATVAHESPLIASQSYINIVVSVCMQVRCSLEQMLEEGYYHSDPHPGNLFKLPSGELAYIDFGMMGEIDAPIRRSAYI